MALVTLKCAKCGEIFEEDELETLVDTVDKVIEVQCPNCSELIGKVELPKWLSIEKEGELKGGE